MDCSVSVIIPVFNKAEYLQNIFDCLLKQTFKDFECLLIDDGSTDGSGMLCDRISDSDKRFRVFHIENGGVSHARNIGLSAAQGEYIAFIDSDDSIPENYLYTLFMAISQSNADIVICSLTKTWTDGKKQTVEMPPAGVYEKKELLTDFASVQKKTGIYGYCCGKIFSGKLAEKTRFDENLRLAEDFDFLLRLYPFADRICFTDETTYLYLQEAENSSSLTDDREIDYRAQLTINLRYKHFLAHENALDGKNREIVRQLLSNYVFFTIFYCDICNLKDVLNDLSSLCGQEEIALQGRNAFEKWIFLLLRRKCFGLIRITMQSYLFARKLLRRR